MGAGVLQFHVGVRHAVVVVGRLGGAHFQLRGQQSSVALDHEVGGALFGLRHVLRYLAHAPLRWHVVLAAIFMQRAIEQGKEGRLAGAVASDQPHFLTRIDGYAGSVEKHLGAAAQGHTFKGYQGNLSGAERSRRRNSGRCRVF